MSGQTDFLVRVANRADAEIALAGGADRLGLSNARGPLSRQTVADLLRIVDGRVGISAGLDILEPDETDAAHVLAGEGVDTIEWAADAAAPAALATFRRRFPTVRAVAVFCADAPEKLRQLGQYAEAGFHAALLRRGAGSATRLIEAPGIEALAAFVTGAHRRGLAAWLEGALEPPDVPRMLALQPDVLAFRTSLGRHGRRDADLDPARVAEVRELIPRGAVPIQRTGTLALDEVSPAPQRRDRVFVRDFIVEAGIGAYRFEHRAPQRMRFNVEAELAPIPDAVADMRDIFSYDVIVDAIRLATRHHVLLVERIALDVANATLRDGRVKRVRVRVEKLDILDGSVGVEIERDAN